MKFEENLKKKKDPRYSLIPKSEKEDEAVIEQEVVDGAGGNSFEDVKQNVLNMYQAKQDRQRVEDTHVRYTFLFRNDLKDRLKKLTDGKRGMKTLILNQAIEALLDELEKDNQ